MSKKLTPDDVHAMLRRAVRHEPDERVWADLVDDRYVTEVIAGEDGAREELIARYKTLHERFVATPRARVDPRPYEIPPDGASIGLAAIVAIEARRDPRVVAFRKKRLRRARVVDAEAWVRRRAATPSSASLTEIRVSSSETEFRRERLEIPTKHGFGSVYIDADGPLGELRRIARWLVSQFPIWTEADAVGFVLTDDPPAPRLAAIEFFCSSAWPEASTVTLTVSPRARPRDVAKLYAEARDEVFRAPRRQRAPTPQKIHAAVFAAERNDGRTWRSVADEWNATRGERRYGDWRQFARDCRMGYAAATGNALVWKGARNSGTSGEPVDEEQLERLFERAARSSSPDGKTGE